MTMYEDALRPRPVALVGPRDWLRVWWELSVVIFVAVGLALGVGCIAGGLAGCADNPAGATYGTDAADVAGRNAAAVVGFTGAGDNAPALLDALADLPGHLVWWGAPAILAGAVLLSRPESPRGLGFGLLGGGLLLLLCAAVLPLFCGWIGLGLIVAALAFYFLRKNPDTGTSPLATVSGFVGRLKSLI